MTNHAQAVLNALHGLAAKAGITELTDTTGALVWLQRMAAKSAELPTARILEDVQLYREEVAKHIEQTSYGPALASPWAFLQRACDYLEQLISAKQAVSPELARQILAQLNHVNKCACWACETMRAIQAGGAS